MRFPRNYWPQTGNCFVMMPFGKKELHEGRPFDWDEHYKEVIDRAVAEAGMKAIRADEIYGAMPLLDRLWQGIQEAELVIADLTGRSPNVLYEVGLAHVIGKRILILTMYPEDVPVDLGEFVQIRYSAEGRGLLQLDRDLKNNIEAARKNPSAEAMLTPLPGQVGGVSERAPATVIHVTATFATVETKEGRRGFLNAEDFAWNRKPKDLTKVLKVGKELEGAFVADLNGQQRYSLIAHEPNPWSKLEKEFPVGNTFKGIVVNHLPGVGLFVDMRYKIHGFIPEVQVPRDLGPGSEVRAQVERIDPARREVKLRFIDVPEPSRLSGPAWGPFHKGQAFEGTITRVQQDKGFILVQVNDSTAGLLPIARMSQQIRNRFLAQELRPGDHVSVEVVDVDGIRQRLVLRDRRVEGMTTGMPPYPEVSHEPAPNYERALQA
jgi:small subunit ribosomal protein S1